MTVKGYLNTSTPFAAGEHDVIWKSAKRYHDFSQSDEELDHCNYPRFWGDAGHQVHNLIHLVGCRDSEFDQYGEVASFGNYPEWVRQLSKFAFVQDRLREWRPSVLAKIQHFSCMTIASLDIDGFRIDKALQVTVDAQGENFLLRRRSLLIPIQEPGAPTFGNARSGTIKATSIFQARLSPGTRSVQSTSAVAWSLRWPKTI